MHSPALKPISIALFPSADRSTLLPNPHQQQHYLSPPLTPFLKHLSPEDQSRPPNSPPSYFPPSLPAIRDMLPPERRPDTVPTALENHVLPGSAPERHSQLEFTETLGAIPSSTVRGATTVQDPSRLQQVFPSQSLNGIPPSSAILSPLLRRNKAHVASACVNCKKAHLACDANRPCRRCVSLDKQDSCVDVQHKRRGRPRLKDTAPGANSPQGERRTSYLNRHVSDDDAWKLQPPQSPFSARDAFRREYHHSRSYSLGSQPTNRRHHPYGNPTPPTSGYAGLAASRNTSGYFDLPSPSTTHPPSYSFPAPNSPNYYSYPNLHSTGRQSRDAVLSPPSPYHNISTPRGDETLSRVPTRPQPLLPLPETSHHALSRRDSFHLQPTLPESPHYSHRPPLQRTESVPVTERGLDRGGDADRNDSVTLPSLKDLGVPLR